MAAAVDRPSCSKNKCPCERTQETLDANMRKRVDDAKQSAAAHAAGANPYSRDIDSGWLVHKADGEWVCSSKLCGHPISLHSDRQHAHPNHAAAGCWKVTARFPRGAGALNLRRKVFEYAEKCIAYDAAVEYSTNASGLIDATCDLNCTMYFEDKHDAETFRTHAVTAPSVYHDLEPVQQTLCRDAKHQCTTRVFKHSYDASDSPKRTEWNQSDVHRSVSEPSASRHSTTVLDTEQIELESICDPKKTRLKFEGCHINAALKHTKRGDAASNIMPLPSDFHALFDGRVDTDTPLIDIIPLKVMKQKQNGRTLVKVQVRFKADAIEREYAHKLRNPQKSGDGYVVAVYKHEPDEFCKRLTERHNSHFPGEGLPAASRKRARESGQ